MKCFMALLTTALVTTSLAHAGGDSVYRVTITNATSHQVLTPALLIAHDARFRLFSVGAVASDGLAYQAENGDPSIVHGEVAGAAGVADIRTGGLILPGQSESIDIVADKKSLLTYTAMLATTNDGFASLNGVELPKKSAQYFAYAYDAGSEMNNETCTYIPGPPCTMESGNARSETGEGFISIHNGIHGGNDLNPKQLDWRGPVAVITVERLGE